MSFEQPLFAGRQVWLGPLNPERDAPQVAGWSEDPGWLSLVQVHPIMPLSTAQAQRRLEALLKEMDEEKNCFFFNLHHREDGRLLGLASIRSIEWTHGSAWVRLAIGAQADWGKGYGREALSLLLTYAFEELNLYRLGAEVFEFNERARRFFQNAGFIQEVCRRKALPRAGQSWDILLYGLLRPEWEARRDE